MTIVSRHPSSRYLLFELPRNSSNDVLYAINTETVTRIVVAEAVVGVPGTPTSISGMRLLEDGTLAAVVSLSELLGFSEPLNPSPEYHLLISAPSVQPFILATGAPRELFSLAEINITSGMPDGMPSVFCFMGTLKSGQLVAGLDPLAIAAQVFHGIPD